MTALGLIAIGVVAGGVAASLGVGGGIVYVPALVTFFSFTQHEAQGTSLAVIVPSTVVAVVVHARARRVDWGMAAGIALGGVLGGVLGARVALALDAEVLRRVFAVFLVLTATRMAMQIRRRQRG